MTRRNVDPSIPPHSMSRRSAPADSDTPTFAAGFINHKVVSKAERRAIHEAAEKAAQEKKAAKKAANQAKIDAAAQAKEQRKAAAARKAERKARHEAEVQAAQERKAAKQAAAPAALAAAGAKKKSKQIVDTAEGERSREERYRAQQAQHRAPAPKLPMPRKEASSAPRAAMKPEPASHKADEVPRFDAAFTFPDDAGPSAAGPSSSARVAAAKEEEAEEEEGEWMGDASFTLDAAPSQPFGLEALAKPVVRAPSPLRQEQQVNGLLLPGHVQIDAPAASPERTAAQEEEARKDDLAAQGELGDYAQLDDTSGKGRYYDAEEKAERMAREECPVCGELGHDKKGCTHSQCLACGALDEHSTRDCPLGVVCFRCGNTGHRSQNCPVPRRHGGYQSSCARCGSPRHVEKNCPTLWRIYAFSTNGEWRRFRRRKAMGADESDGNASGSDMAVSSGEDDAARKKRERSPARDWDPAVLWCYNCAAAGSHWGDDCPLPRCNPTRSSGDPSTFSDFLSRSGPFGQYLPDAPDPWETSYGDNRGAGGSRQSHHMPASRAGAGIEFSVGPGASMHLAADPSRGAAQTVDDLFAGIRPAGRGHSRARRQPDHGSSRTSSRDEQASKRRRHEEAERDEEPDWFDRHSAPSGSKGSHAGRHGQSLADRLASGSSPRNGGSSSKRPRRDMDSDSDSDDSHSRSGRSDRKGGKKSSKNERMRQRKEQSERDRAAHQARVAAGGGSSERIDEDARREQSRRDRERNRMAEEARSRRAGHENRSRGEPSFGPYSRDDGERRAPQSDSRGFRPQYNGGY